MKSSLLLIALAAALGACSKPEAPVAKTERPAMTQLVGALAAQGGNTYSGEVRARHEISMGFRVAGKVVERLVDTGAAVKAGQVLARLDPSDASLQAGAAAAQLKLIEADVKRYRELRSKGFVSQSALDAKEAALTAASAQAGLTHNQTDYAVLKAEHDGVVAATMAEVGQVVAIGQPVLRLAGAGELEVAIDIPENRFSGHHVGEAAMVQVAGGESVAGRLRELSQSADPASRTYPARVSFQDASGRVALGMTAQVKFGRTSAGNAALLIPVSAVYQQGPQTAVWVVAADRTVRLRPVEISAYRDEGAVVVSGLSAGERIVSAGVHRLSEGEKIRLIESGNAQ